jgi:hypothetical protein
LRLNRQIKLGQLAIAAVDLVIHARFTQLLETLVFNWLEGKPSEDELRLQLVTRGFQPRNDRLNFFLRICPWKYLRFEATSQKNTNLVPDLCVAHGVFS